jgi:hypothetical protein
VGRILGFTPGPAQADQCGSVQAPHKPDQVEPLQNVSKRHTSIPSCRSVFVRPAGLLPGSLTAYRFKQLASLRSVQGVRPLRCSVAILLTLLHRFLPAGHAKHEATPPGVFDWTQSSQSGGWGSPNKRMGISKTVSPCPACLFHRKPLLLL